MSQTDVIVDITKNTPALSAPGFGTPFMLGYTTPIARTSRVGTYSDIDGLAADYAIDAPEYLWGAAIFSQDSHPEQIKIGLGVLPPTMAYEVGIAAVKSSHNYQLEVFGTGFAFTALTVPSGVGATNDTICALLVTALNGVASRNYTAAATGSTGSHVVAITANSAGAWFSVRIVETTDLKNKLTHADPGVASDLGSLNAVDSDWYALGTVYNSKLYVLGCEAFIASNASKLYLWDVPETDALKTTAGNGDTGDASKLLSYSRASGAYYDDPSKMETAAHYGATLGFDPGKVNFKFKTLQGVPPLVLTDTDKVNLKARFMNSYEVRFGRPCTFEGYTFDGLFVDNQRNRDWLTQTMIVNVAQPLFDNPNVPMNDRGVQIFVGKMKKVLGMAVDQEVLLDDPKPTATGPKAKDISSADRAAKILRGLQFTGIQASGVNTIRIKGSISFGD